LIGIGGFILFTQFMGSMIAILTVATIFSFLAAPIIGFLNLRAIQSDAIPQTHRPKQWLMLLARIGLIVMTLFSLYYIYDLFVNGFHH
jgi:Mn2+/Fe2+ NRAMP family transporter